MPVRAEVIQIDAVIDDIQACVPGFRSASYSELAAAIRARGFESAKVFARMRRRGLWRPWQEARFEVHTRAASGYREEATRTVAVHSSARGLALWLAFSAVLYLASFAFLVVNDRPDWIVLAMLVLVAPSALVTALRLWKAVHSPQSIDVRTATLAGVDVVARKDIAYFTCADQLSAIARRAMPAASEWLAGFTRSAMWCALAVTKDGVPIVLARDLDRASARATVVTMEHLADASRIRTATREQEEE